MVSKNYVLKKYSIFLFLLFVFSSDALLAQTPKKVPPTTTSQTVKPPPKVVPPPKGKTAAKEIPSKTTTKGTAKGTLAADMDCLVKINGGTKLYSVKAYTPLDVPINVGNNVIEATSTDKKSTFKRTIAAQAGETVVVEISFFDPSKFLDYIKSGNISMVESALKKDPSLLNNDEGTLTSSPLEIAIENSQPELVKYLMSKGASFLKPDNIFPLHKSILYVESTKSAKDKPPGDREMVDLFLSKGCKVTDTDDGGNTPLHCAVRVGKLDMMVYLIEKGANVNAKNDFGDTPLAIAENKGMVSIIDYLKTKGALEK